MNASSQDWLMNAAGSTSDSGPIFVVLMPCVLYFYTMKPEQGSRPMSERISDLYPEVEQEPSLEDLKRHSRGRIYAEVLGGNVNSGGQRSGNNDRSKPIAVQSAKDAIANAGIQADELIPSTVI
jgi:hypothetical protein